MLEAGDLTTHGVIVGMTGSGKTGLGVVLIEEALLAGIPALVIDPKGDLGNLLLTFPELKPDDFAPWVEAGDPAEVAKQWSEGLAGWGIEPSRIAQLRDAAEFTIYTPGSSSGVPLDLVGGLDAPGEAADAEAVADEVEGYVSGLLTMVGIDADPLASREHILLSNLIHHAWSSGQGIDLAGLVGQVLDPPLRKLGVYELDAFYPANERSKLAMTLNGLLASHSFAAWAQGPDVDLDRLLRAQDGDRPACAIVALSHLSDPERQFVVSLLLGKLITWMRRQPGTDRLRVLVHFDKVMGFVPPTAAIAVDHDERDLRPEAPPGASYVLTDAPLDRKTFFTGVEKALLDHLYRTRTMQVMRNPELKLVVRAGETPDEFAARCSAAADEGADRDQVALQAKYEARIAKARDAVGAAMDRVAQAEAAETTRRQSDVVAGAGSLLGAVLGGRRSARTMARDMGRVLTGQGRRDEAAQRIRTAENRAADRQEALTKLEADLARDLATIEATWAAKAAATEPIEVPLERSDIRVTDRCVVWIPVG